MFETYDKEILRFIGDGKQTGVAGPRLGIVGGGQLAKMTAMAALRLGCDVRVLERNNYSPAANLASHSIVGDYDNPEALLKLASEVDVVTLENEFVDARALTAIEQAGGLLLPSAATIAVVQDKLAQKQALAAADLPVPAFRAVASPAEIAAAAAAFGWPLVVKTCRNGYDGKGNATVRGEADLDAAWRKLGAGKTALYVEEWCAFERELAVMVTRGRDHRCAVYPVVETVQRDHICHEVLAPAPIPAELAREAASLAESAVAAVGGVGTFGVEMFLSADGSLILNELAPRVHNSGHYTIEACHCSQFENHVRAVLGWPLGDTGMVAPAAAMVNLLGKGLGPGRPRGIEEALAVPGAHVHVYGKAMSGAGRKMGHVTALGDSVEQASLRARQAAQYIQFGDNA